MNKGLLLESCVIKRYHQSWKVKSIEWWLDQLCCILYGAECWPLKDSYIQKMKIRMLWWMCVHTNNKKIRNDDIRDKVRVASLVDKMTK